MIPVEVMGGQRTSTGMALLHGDREEGRSEEASLTALVLAVVYPKPLSLPAAA